MKMMHAVFATLALGAFAFTPLPIRADDDYPNIFVKMCEKSPDGKVTKAEVMEVVEKAFDKHDTRKEGKLDKKQTEAFLKNLTRESGS
jgi:hypothetical protein